MSESLENFFTGPIFEKALFKFPQGPFLEVGCGKKPILPDLVSMLGEVDCIDHSESAIRYCHENFDIGNYLHQDLLELDGAEKYGMILDAHCLHCLQSIEDFKQALKNIYSSLKPAGFIFLETMVLHSKMAFEEGFHYENETHLLKKGERISRIILPSLMIEKFFLEAGFQIEYLHVNESKRMIPHDAREFALEEDPQIIRLIASKAEAF